MRKKIMTILIAFVMIFSVAAPSALNPSGATTVSVAKKKMTMNGICQVQVLCNHIFSYYQMI